MRLSRSLGLIFLGLIAVSCGGSSVGTVEIRALNLVRGATSVTITADSGTLGTLTYGATSSYTSMTAFPQTISATDPTTSQSIGVTTLSPAAGSFYTVVTYGIENGFPAQALAINLDSEPSTSTTAANVRFGNFSTVENQAVDVYITAANVTIPGPTATFTDVAYGTFTSYVSMPGGSYEIRVYATGTTTTPLLTLSSSSIANGADYSLLAADTNASPAAGQILSIQDVY